MTPPLFRGKTTIITGGARGIGRAIALELASQGSNVVLTYERSREAAEDAASDIKRLGSSAICIQADVRDYSKARDVVEEAKRHFGGVDLLVNNAGIIRDKPLMLMEPNDWSEVIQTNLTGCFNYSKAAIVTFMKQKRGKILNISSISGIAGITGQTNYAASKLGMIGFTRALAREVAAYGITVNALAPGYVETDAVHAMKDRVRQEGLAQIPMQRFATGDEIAKIAAFLLSESAGYITGQVVIADGGFCL